MKTKTKEKTRFAPMIEWELTRGCNYRCAHCYVFPHRPRRHEMNTQEAMDVARTLAEAGCKSVTLSGGEPTLRDDWHLVAETLASRNVGVQVFTNGHNIDAETARIAKESGVRFVFVSLDGMKKSHDLIRKKCGAFEKALRAIVNLQDQGIPVGINTTLLSPNIRDLTSMSSLVREFDIPLWMIWLGMPTKNKYAPLWLKEKRVPALVKELRKIQACCHSFSPGDNLNSLLGTKRISSIITSRGSGSSNPVPAEALSPSSSSYIGGCPAGVYTLALKSDGNVTLCPALGESAILGNLTGESPQTIMERARNEKLGFCIQARKAHTDKKHLFSRHPCHATRLAYKQSAAETAPTNSFLRKTACIIAAAGLAASPLACRNVEKPDTSSQPRPSANSGHHDAASPPTSESPSPSPLSKEADGAKKTKDQGAVPSTESIETETGAKEIPDTKHRNEKSEEITKPDLYDPDGRYAPNGMPLCCMMHVIVPGCRCEYPAVKVLKKRRVE